MSDSVHSVDQLSESADQIASHESEVLSQSPVETTSQAENSAPAYQETGFRFPTLSVTFNDIHNLNLPSGSYILRIMIDGESHFLPGISVDEDGELTFAEADSKQFHFTFSAKNSQELSLMINSETHRIATTTIDLSSLFREEVVEPVEGEEETKKSDQSEFTADVIIHSEGIRYCAAGMTFIGWDKSHAKDILKAKVELCSKILKNERLTDTGDAMIKSIRELTQSG
eukprot:GHVH01001309.1.p2 GENE.GHVH01001309.1~~GHVH01001309.1.p2  ORF type:complete len:228 (+),score=42.88 GHVH01001309.1:359-1042(+)